MKKFPLEAVEKFSVRKIRSLQLERLRWSLITGQVISVSGGLTMAG